MGIRLPPMRNGQTPMRNSQDAQDVLEQTDAKHLGITLQDGATKHAQTIEMLERLHAPVKKA